jgi:glycerophosphoryl diester phosphodiesterase
MATKVNPPEQTCARRAALPRVTTLVGPLAKLLLTASLSAIAISAAADCGGIVLHAHRGAPEHPENSLPAVRAALAGSWDGVEIDLQQLRDGTSVLHHDPLLGRTTSLRGRTTGSLDATAWREVRLKNRKGELTREPPPFLEEVLGVMKDSPKVLNAEIKQSFSNCAVAERTVRAMREGREGGQWFVTAIERAHLRCARQVDPAGYLGIIVLDLQSAALQERRIAEPLRVPQPQLDARWLEVLQREVGAPVGVHLDIHTLASQPAILAMARDRGMPVFTYSLADDRRHAETLRRVAERTQLWPTGAVIDGDPDAFCRALR